MNPALKAVAQLLWPYKDREEWFSLGENHEKLGRWTGLKFVLSGFHQHSSQNLLDGHGY
jgi:hypothetical protein